MLLFFYSLLVSLVCLLVSVVPAAMGCLGGKTDEERLDEKAKREANKKIEKQLQKERQAYKATHRLLLLGQSPVLSVHLHVCLSVTQWIIISIILFVLNQPISI